MRVSCVQEAFGKYGAPELFNTGDGSRLTSEVFIRATREYTDLRIRTDGTTRAPDNGFIERLWRSLQHEKMCLKTCSSGVNCVRAEVCQPEGDHESHHRPKGEGRWWRILVVLLRKFGRDGSKDSCSFCPNGTKNCNRSNSYQGSNQGVLDHSYTFLGFDVEGPEHGAVNHDCPIL